VTLEKTAVMKFRLPVVEGEGGAAPQGKRRKRKVISARVPI
jgi:hypothetical protein